MLNQRISVMDSWANLLLFFIVKSFSCFLFQIEYITYVVQMVKWLFGFSFYTNTWSFSIQIHRNYKFRSGIFLFCIKYRNKSLFVFVFFFLSKFHSQVYYFSLIHIYWAPFPRHQNHFLLFMKKVNRIYFIRLFFFFFHFIESTDPKCIRSQTE